MDFMTELSSVTGLPLFLVAGSYKYSVIAGQAVHISGCKNILKFDSSEMVIGIPKNKKLVINGEKLEIKKMFNSDLVIIGKIISVTEA